MYPMQNKQPRHPIATVRSPLVANQPQILSLSNATAKGRRRIRQLLGLKPDEPISPGFVADARHKACQHTLQSAQRVVAKRVEEAQQRLAAAK